VFARFDDLGLPRSAAPDSAILGRLPDAAADLRDANDLWPAAVSLEPQLGGLRDELERLTSVPWLMSGSGSTLFALYASAEEAAAAGTALLGQSPPLLEGALLNAVDLVGPDPAWRHEWPTKQ
jgi:4-diphosphocytidyl-2C-methyl-D-erythritol kinase